MREVVVRFRLPGTHCWPTCDIPQVDYLQHKHRHVFHFECRAEVQHNDRQLEFMVLRNRLVKDLQMCFGNDKDEALNFDWRSCEALAQYLLNKFAFLSQVSVFEDGENGAVLTR